MAALRPVAMHSRLRRGIGEAVVSHLSDAEEASRADLARALGRSPSTIAAAVGELIAAGRVEEVAPPEHGRAVGRPATRLRIRFRGHVLGVEFDHDRVHIAVADRDGNFVAGDSRLVDTARSAPDAVRTAADLCRQTLGGTSLSVADIRAVGVAVPGPVDVAGGVVGSSSVLPNWRTANVARLVREHLRDVPVTIDNDANLGALAEAAGGAGRDVDNFVFVKVAVGLGAAIYLDGRLFRGSYGAAGELGHVTVPGETTPCRCGNLGCLETVSSSLALVRQVAITYPEVTDLSALRALHERDSLAIDRVLYDMGSRVGVQLANLCTVLDIDRVIIGGVVAELSTEYLAGLRETIRRWARPQLAPAIRVDASALGTSAGLTGAVIAARSLALAL